MLYRFLELENLRQQETLSMIASESIPWPSVIKAYHGSLLCTKYAEGYPGSRYYGGCEYADQIESMAIEAGKKLFRAEHINVQPLCGSNANLAVFLALLRPGDKILGMDLKAGGHLTHGSKVSLSGKWFDSYSYGLSESYEIDYENIRELANRIRPKLIIAGFSSYPRRLDMEKFRAIADEVDALLLADIAHVAGLVAGDAYPNPLPYAHVVTSTTHKTLRGPRGGMILTNRADLAKAINKAVFPGLQGGPFMDVIAGKAAAFNEDYREYSHKLIENTKAIGEGLKMSGVKLVADYDGKITDTHILLLDLRNSAHNGTSAESLLEKAKIVCNKNAIPNDTSSPSNPSGIRLGGTVATNRGLNSEECRGLGEQIGKLLNDANELLNTQNLVSMLCQKYPIPFPIKG